MVIIAEYSTRKIQYGKQRFIVQNLKDKIHVEIASHVSPDVSPLKCGQFSPGNADFPRFHEPSLLMAPWHVILCTFEARDAPKPPSSFIR